jgi:hypothetical protein
LALEASCRAETAAVGGRGLAHSEGAIDPDEHGEDSTWRATGRSVLASADLDRHGSFGRSRYREETDSSAFAILIGVYPGEGARRSASRRFAGPIETIAQGVAQRVIDLVLESLDVNALIDRINLNAVLSRVELNDLLRRVDLNEVLDQVDLNQVIERVDVNQVIDRVDLNQVIERVDVNQVLDRVDVDRLVARLDVNALIDRVDINEIAGRIDIEALVKNTDLGALLASSSSTIVTEAVDVGRGHAVNMDDTLARWVSRLRRNHTGRAGPPELLNAQEES